MDFGEIVSLAANALLGGGLVVTLATLRHKRRAAEQDAEKLALDNSERALRLYSEYFTRPLKEEVARLYDKLDQAAAENRRLAAEIESLKRENRRLVNEVSSLNRRIVALTRDDGLRAPDDDDDDEPD